jgi:hypothetical protein
MASGIEMNDPGLPKQPQSNKHYSSCHKTRDHHHADTAQIVLSLACARARAKIQGFDGAVMSFVDYLYELAK